MALQSKDAQYVSVFQGSAEQTSEYNQHTISNHQTFSSHSHLFHRKPVSSRLTYTPVGADPDEDPRSMPSIRSDRRPLQTGYNPLFARRWVFVSFAGLWLAVIASLQILLSMSDKHKGLVTTQSSLKYLWTYGPTAFFVLITVLWRQVDYAAKHLQPWASMAKGPTSAELSLLMDYTTPMQVISFWRSLRRRHFAISATIIVFVFIKISTVASTGLLALQPLQFTELHYPVRVTTGFDDSQRLVPSNVTYDSAVAVFAAKEFNLTLPNDTTTFNTFQHFEPLNKLPDDASAFSTTIDVFVPAWECQVGILSYTNGYDVSVLNDSGPLRVRQLTSAIAGRANPNYWNSTIEFPDCVVSNIRLNASFFDDPDIGGQYNQGPQHRYRASRLDSICSQADPSLPENHRSILAVTYDEVTMSEDNSTILARLLNHSVIGCMPTYSINPALVSMFADGSFDRIVALAAPGRQLPSVNGTHFVEAIAHSLSESPFVDDYQRDALLSSGSTDGLFLGMMILDENFLVEDLLDPEWLERQSEDVFTKHATQLALQYLLTPINLTLDGSIERNRSRLCAQELPTRVMQGFAAFVLVITAVMLYLMPQQVTPRAVDSIAGTATILARSPAVNARLSCSGSLDLEGLRKLLVEDQYFTLIVSEADKHTFSIQKVAGKNTSPTLDPDSDIEWMQPLILRRFILVLVVVVVASIVISLEVLYHFSETRNGLAMVDPQKLARYAWLYVPVIVMLVVATTFNFLDFDLNLAYPLQMLSGGHLAAQSSILWTPLKQTALHTLPQALSKSRWALAASSTAVILAPILTIVASGLLSPQLVTYNTAMAANTLNWFSAIPTSDFEYYFPIPSLLLRRNMSDPAWTFDELTFPELDLSTHVSSTTMTGSQPVRINTLAIRARVNCSSLPSTLVTTAKDPNSNRYTSVNATLTGYCNGVSQGSGFFLPITNPGLSCVVEPIEPPFSSSLECSLQYLAMCTRVRDGEGFDTTALVCNTGLETVRTNATLDALTGQVIDVMVDESSAMEVLSGYRPNPQFAPYFFDPSASVPTESYGDGFAEVMVYGKDGVPAEELLQPDVLAKQFTHTYRQWMAQALNTYARKPLAELPANQNWISTPPTKQSASFQNEQQRLFINKISLRILDGLLCALLLCLFVIITTVDTSRVFPKDMGSIAATASLLAGSKFLDEKSGLIPPGTEWLSDQEILERKVWDGKLFSMGWWPEEGGMEQGRGAEGSDKVVSTSEVHEVQEVGERRFGIDCHQDSEELRDPPSQLWM